MEHRRYNIFLFLFVLFYFTIAAAGAAIPLTGYTTRIERAHTGIGELVENETSGDRFRERISAIKRLVPKQQDVQFDGHVVRVDNSWLHNAIDEVVKKPEDDTEGRQAMLTEISERLSALLESIRQSQKVTSGDDRKAQLDRILARPEYHLDEVRESTIKNFLKRLWDEIERFLKSLAPTSVGGSEMPKIGGLLSGFRILLVLLVLVASVIGAIYLAKRLSLVRRQEEEKGVRKVLGEEIAGDATSGDFLANAAELAKQGDYRTAIRRVYIALLLDLERRGDLPLHPSKTNRDYLNALQSDEWIYPTFSTMTGTYEMTWYGERGATEEEFNGFVSHYETIGD